jgi:hypothetical protein
MRKFHLSFLIPTPLFQNRCFAQANINPITNCTSHVMQEIGVKEPMIKEAKI